MPDKGKIIHSDSEFYTALRQLADDRMASLQELADEVSGFLLKRHDRPVGVKVQLKASVTDSTIRELLTGSHYCE